MNAHVPKGLAHSDYEQVRGALLAMAEEAREAYREGCAARIRGEIDEPSLLELKAAVDEAETRLHVLDDGVREERRLSDEQARAQEAESRQRSIEQIECEWGNAEEAFATVVEGIAALGSRVSTILQALDSIVREASMHRESFGSHQAYGELVRDVRDIDFRMRGIVHKALADAGLGVFVLGIDQTPSVAGNHDPESALVIKRRAISRLLGRLSRTPED